MHDGERKTAGNTALDHIQMEATPSLLWLTVRSRWLQSVASRHCRNRSSSEMVALQ